MPCRLAAGSLELAEVFPKISVYTQYVYIAHLNILAGVIVWTWKMPTSWGLGPCKRCSFGRQLLVSLSSCGSTTCHLVLFYFADYAS